MNVNRQRRVLELFRELVDAPPAQRDAALAAVAKDDPELPAELRRLLHADDHFETTQRMIAVDVGALLDPGSDVPDEIGRYRIKGVLGRGGCGIVYRAEQDKPRRDVALKLLHSRYEDKALVRRFEREGEVLGRLHHPGIAQIYESGWTDTPSGRRPFFPMELVEGVPITDYASANRLSVEAKLRLIAEVCDAVEHAHQRGVVHRDLKPGNILVDGEGRPRVLDFGVARVLADDPDSAPAETLEGMVIGTLAYMSPEQASGSTRIIDARTDVYALGTVAYELLTGRLPIEVRGRPVPDALLALRDREPEPLTSARPGIPPDVATIVHKALTKEPTRRYAHAAHLADDLRRFLTDQPILARPPSAVYRLRKFTRRHRALSAAILVLVAGLASSVALFVRAERARAAERLQREEADRQTATARAVLDLMVETFSAADPVKNGLGREITAAELLRVAGERLEPALGARPVALAAGHGAIGTAFDALGLHGEARPHLEAALAALESEGGAGRRADPARLHALLASGFANDGRFAEAAGHIDAAERALEALPDPAATHRVKLLSTRGKLHYLQGRSTDARRDFEECIDLLRTLPGAGEGELVPHLRNVATQLLVLGQLDACEEVLAEARRIIERGAEVKTKDEVDLAQTEGTVAFVRGDAAKAVEHFQRALDWGRRTYGENSPMTVPALINLGVAWRNLDRTEDAIRCFRNVLAILDAEGSKHSSPIRATALNNLGRALEATGDLDLALQHYEMALGIYRGIVSGEHRDVLTSRHNVARVLGAKGELEAAMAELRDVIERRRTLGPNHFELVDSLELLCTFHVQRKDFAAAERVIQDAIQACAASPIRADQLRLWLISALLGQGSLEEAERVALEVHARASQCGPSCREVARHTEKTLAGLYRSLGRSEEAEAWSQRALSP